MSVFNWKCCQCNFPISRYFPQIWQFLHDMLIPAQRSWHDLLVKCWRTHLSHHSPMWKWEEEPKVRINFGCIFLKSIEYIIQQLFSGTLRKECRLYVCPACMCHSPVLSLRNDVLHSYSYAFRLYFHKLCLCFFCWCVKQLLDWKWEASLFCIYY